MQILTENITLIDFVYKQILRAKDANRNNVFVLTTNRTNDDSLAEYLEQKNILFYRGDEKNVFKRFYNFIKQTENKYEYIFRVCSDNPFVEPLFINALSELAEKNQNQNYDYLSYQSHEGKPAILTHYGLFCELVSVAAMARADKMIQTEYQREHVTPIFYQSIEFNKKYLSMPNILRDKPYRFTIDTADDAEAIKKIINNIDIDNFTYNNVINTVDNDPSLIALMKNTMLNNPKETKN